jgi:hypothetical protein
MLVSIISVADFNALNCSFIVSLLINLTSDISLSLVSSENSLTKYSIFMK